MPTKRDRRPVTINGDGWEINVVEPQLHDVDGVLYPDRFRYTETENGIDVTLEIELTASGPECRKIELSSSGAAIPATALRRVEMRRMMRNAPLGLMRYIADVNGYGGAGGGRWFVYGFEGDLPSGRRGEHVTMTESPRPAETSRRGKAIDVDLARVAETYRTAHQLGQPPTETVAREYHVGRTTASRWIKRCRDQGLLGSARAGSAGEFGPPVNDG